MAAFFSALYRFKPGRTFAQALVGLLVGSTVFDIDWVTALGGAALAGLVSLLQIWAEGGEMLAEDERVTRTKVEPVDVQSRLAGHTTLPEDTVRRGTP